MDGMAHALKCWCPKQAVVDRRRAPFISIFVRRVQHRRLQDRHTERQRRRLAGPEIVTASAPPEPVAPLASNAARRSTMTEAPTPPDDVAARTERVLPLDVAA